MNAITGFRELFEAQDYEAIPAYICRLANFYLLENSVALKHLTLRSSEGLMFTRGVHIASLTRVVDVTAPIDAKLIYICTHPHIDPEITDARITEIVEGITIAVDRLFALATKHLLQLDREPDELDYADVQGFIAVDLITNSYPPSSAPPYKEVLKVRHHAGDDHKWTFTSMEFGMTTRVAINIDLVNHE